MAKKDIAEKALESYNDVFADIVNVLLFNGERLVSEEELLQGKERSSYFGDDGLREQERDTSKYWKKNDIRIAYIGLENQTVPDNDMPLRVIGYDGATYRDQIRVEKGKDGKRRRLKERYPVITLVLYFGYENRWDKAKSLYDSLGEIDDRLKPYVQDYPINLFEIAYLPDEVVGKFQSDFRIVADYLAQMRKTGKYIGTQEEIRHVRELLQLMAALTGDDKYTRAYETIQREKKEGITMHSVLDDYIEQGIDKGKQEMLLELVNEGNLSREVVAGRMGRTVDEVDKLVAEWVKKHGDQRSGTKMEIYLPSEVDRLKEEEREEGRKEGQIKECIELSQELACSRADTKERVIMRFKLDEDEAEEKLREFWIEKE